MSGDRQIAYNVSELWGQQRRRSYFTTFEESQGMMPRLLTQCILQRPLFSRFFFHAFCSMLLFSRFFFFFFLSYKYSCSANGQVLAASRLSNRERIHTPPFFPCSFISVLHASFVLSLRVQLNSRSSVAEITLVFFFFFFFFFFFWWGRRG